MRTLLKVLAAIGAGLAALAAIAIYVMTKGPDLTAYETYREPKLITLPAQPMLVLERIGDPNQVGPTVFKELFSIYYEVEEVPRGAPPAPRARWSSVEVAKDQWRGLYAMPLPSTVKAVPAGAQLQTWTYGEVAQLLYEGPYAGEEPAIAQLHVFIEAQGHQISGAHEEEYLRGPGMFGRGDPSHYLTLIRYPVTKKEPLAPQM